MWITRARMLIFLRRLLRSKGNILTISFWKNQRYRLRQPRLTHFQIWTQFYTSSWDGKLCTTGTTQFQHQCLRWSLMFMCVFNSVSKMDDFSVRELAKLAIWYETIGSVVETQRNGQVWVSGFDALRFLALVLHIWNPSCTARSLETWRTWSRKLRSLARRLSSTLSIDTTMVEFRNMLGKCVEIVGGQIEQLP